MCCVFVGGNLVSLRSKKQTEVARSSAESEFSAKAQTIYGIGVFSIVFSMGLLRYVYWARYTVYIY